MVKVVRTRGNSMAGALESWLEAACRGVIDARALTVKGENADVIVDGDKPCENRDQELYGTVFIHKGKADTPAKWRPVLRERAKRGTLAPRGTIVGVARLEGRMSSAAARQQGIKEWVDPRAIPNAIVQVIKLKTPVPHRGQLGRWRVSDAALKSIAEQLAEESKVMPSSARIHFVRVDRDLPVILRHSWTHRRRPSSCAPPKWGFVCGPQRIE